MSDMKMHELKTWPEYFVATVSGSKRFEMRLDDRDFRVGDILCLREWLPFVKVYTGKFFYCTIDYILSDFDGLKPGYVVMSISKHTALNDVPF